MLFTLALANLRGLQESAKTFAFPIYLFIGCFTIVLIIGTVKVVVSGGTPLPLQAPPSQPVSLEVVGLWLMVHPFANGCSAMTGIEAAENTTRTVAILIPALIKLHWWEALLHHRRAQRLRSALLREWDPRLVVIDVPWYLEARPTPTLHQLPLTKLRH